jgi:ferritin
MDNFQNNIKDWVSIDNKIKVVNEQLKLLREEKNTRTDNIIHYVNTNNMGNSVVNITDGRLKFTTSRQTAPLTLKHVEECLKKCITDDSQVEALMNFIKESRPTKVVSDIKRTYSTN